GRRAENREADLGAVCFGRGLVQSAKEVPSTQSSIIYRSTEPPVEFRLPPHYGNHYGKIGRPAEDSGTLPGPSSPACLSHDSPPSGRLYGGRKHQRAVSGVERPGSDAPAQAADRHTARHGRDRRLRKAA